MWSTSTVDDLVRRREAAWAGGGEKRTEQQHASGKLTARERLDILFDEGTFVELGTFREPRPDGSGNPGKAVPGDGVVTGYGKIDGRTVYAASQDFTVNGGSLGEAHAQKICHVMDLAMATRCPFISINDSGGARIEEGIHSIAGYAGIFLRNTKASGVIPQIAVILGPCAGGACYSPAICDFIFMTEETSRMFITGPAVVKASMHETITSEELGGAQVHATKSGVVHFVYEDDEATLMGVRDLLSYLPQNNLEEPPFDGETVPVDGSDAIEEIVPENMRMAYDVRDVIDTFVDQDTFLEVQPWFARNVVVGFARLDGYTIGIVANQPSVSAGTLDIDTSDKAARFIRFCDCFNIPLMTLVDVPGYMPGSVQEHNGIIRHGAKILFAYSEATVPKVSLIMRKAYGGAYIAMNSKQMGADLVYAWPIAQIAVMGPEGAVDILYKKQMQNAEDPQAERARLVEEYEKKHLNPYIGAASGYIDDVIAPEDTRAVISSAFDSLRKKQEKSPWKKHGNIPL